MSCRRNGWCRCHGFVSLTAACSRGNVALNHVLYSGAFRQLCSSLAVLAPKRGVSASVEQRLDYVRVPFLGRQHEHRPAVLAVHGVDVGAGSNELPRRVFVAAHRCKQQRRDAVLGTGVDFRPDKPSQ